VITFQEVGKTYPHTKRPALVDLNLEVHDGDLLGLVGLNGAGKSTALRIAAGVTLPDHGSVRLDGYDVGRDKVAASGTVGWVPEAPQFDGGQTCIGTLRRFAGLRGFRGSEAMRRIRDAIDLLSLTGVEHKRVDQLSLGFRKRLAFGVAWMSEPRNLILDEVFNGIDVETTQTIRKRMVQLRKEGRSTIVSSHSLYEIQRLCNRVGILHDGRLVAVTTPDELAYESPKSVRISLDRIDEEATRRLREYGDAEFFGNTVTLVELRARPQEIVESLVRAGYQVLECRTDDTALEAYLLRLTKG